MQEQKTTSEKKKKEKKPIQILRERRGGVRKELIALNREQTKIRKQLLELLKDGPKTVPEISNQTGIPAHKALWYIVGLKKYGEIAEGDERDGYYEYALREEEN